RADGKFWGWAGTNIPLFHAQQFHIEDQPCVGGNGTARATRAITKIRRDDQSALAANTHARHAHIPALDHLPAPQIKFERLPTIHAGVEFGAVGEPAGVMDSDSLTRLR